MADTVGTHSVRLFAGVAHRQTAVADTRRATYLQPLRHGTSVGHCLLSNVFTTFTHSIIQLFNPLVLRNSLIITPPRTQILITQ